jgi:hypothetical protein
LLGSSFAVGPVAAFLALSAVALGDHAAAAEHVEHVEPALRLVAESQLPRLAIWFEGLRRLRLLTSGRVRMSCAWLLLTQWKAPALPHPALGA